MSTSRLWRFLIPLSLFGDVLLFFRKPLFSEQYMFPWDFPTVQVPLISFLADQLKQGSLALWDPYTYCGNPIFANIQACLFHPLIFLAAGLSDLVGSSHLALLIEWAVVIQVGIAGLGAYALMRSLGASQAAAWTSAVMCQTGPYFASRAEHIGAIMAVSWMPVAWLCVVNLAKKPSSRGVALLSISLGMAVLGGLPAATLAVYVSTVLLAILLVLFKIADYRVTVYTGLGCFGGLGLAAIQFIPSVQLTNNSVAKYRLEWLGTGGGLKWQSFVSLVAPNHYHIFDLKNFNGPWDPSFLYLYSSILGLLLAVSAVLFVRTPWVKAFAALAIIGAFWMLGDSTALFRLLYPLVPGSIRIAIHPEYTYCIFANCLAILAGLGMSRLITRAWLQCLIAIVIAIDLYAVGSDRPMNTGPGGDASGISARAVDGDPVTLAKLRRLSEGYRPPARIDTMWASINWAQSATLTRVATANGCSPLALERIIQVRLGLGDKNGRRSGWYYPVVDSTSPVVGLMGDQYLLVGDAAVKQVATSPNFKAVGDLPGVTLFENRAVLPRAFVVSSILNADFDGAIKFIRAKGADFSMTAAVEGAAQVPAHPGEHVFQRPATAVFTKYSANSLTIAVEASAPSYLVVLEAWYPGWRATIGRVETPIYRTDVAFRGVVVPAGRHTVQMDFRPTILIYSALISVFFAGIVTVCLFIEQPRDSRSSSARLSA